MQRSVSPRFEPKLFIKLGVAENFVVRMRVDTDSNTSVFNVRSFAVKRSMPVHPPAGDGRASSQHTQGPTLETFLLLIIIIIYHYHHRHRYRSCRYDYIDYK